MPQPGRSVAGASARVVAAAVIAGDCARRAAVPGKKAGAEGTGVTAAIAQNWQSDTDVRTTARRAAGSAAGAASAFGGAATTGFLKRAPRVCPSST